MSESTAPTTVHNLKNSGVPYDAKGVMVNDDFSTAGIGRALCTCGWLSESLKSGGARREAHKKHKENPEMTARTATPEEDLIGDSAPADDAATETPAADPNENTVTLNYNGVKDFFNVLV